MAQNRKKISIIQRITERILGKKFYIAVVANKGSNSYFVNSTIYRTEAEVKAYKQHIERDLKAVTFIAYYSFRSHNDFRLMVSDGKPVDAEEAKNIASK